MSVEAEEDTLADSIARVGKLLADPERWTPDEIAVGSKGKPCKPLASRAVRWSVAGAVARECYWDLDDGYEANDFAAIYGAIYLAAQRLHRMTVEQVERQLGHAAVLNVLRHAYRWALA